MNPEYSITFSDCLGLPEINSFLESFMIYLLAQTQRGENMSTCKDCIHKGKFQFGGHHIKCKCEAAKSVDKDLLSSMLIFGNEKETIKLIANMFGLEASEHGIKNGWCQFPLNFDDAWVRGVCKFKQTGEDLNNLGSNTKA